MSKVNLIWLGSKVASPDWKLGQVYTSDPNPKSIFQLLNEEIGKSESDAWLIWDSTLGLPNAQAVLLLLKEHVDVWHCGLKLGLNNQPEILKFVAPHWIFIIDTDQEIESVSWRLTLDCCLIRTEVFQRYGLPSPAFTSLEAAGLEFGHRLIFSGAVIKYSPKLNFYISSQTRKIRLEEQVKFIFFTFGKKWAYWCLLHTFFSKPIASLRTLLRLLKWKKPAYALSPLRRIPNTNNATKISVVLPTINRYEYLPECLTSLRNQSLQPREIIIVDQNSIENRKPEIYKQFDDLPIKVIWQAETGQCKARNAALLASSGEWIFFADDDSNYPPDTIEHHWDAVNYYRADGSTGVSVPPKDYVIPKGYTFFRLAFNFDTGNCLVKRNTVINVGAFDLQYDYGKGADSDLGMRIFLNGYTIIHNPKAIRIHYKAKGGLRDYGVMWNNRSLGTRTPRPPVTSVYYYMRYLPKRIIKQAIIKDILLTRAPSSQVVIRRETGIIKAIFLEILLLPQTLFLVRNSVKIAKRKINEGPKLLDPNSKRYSDPDY